MAILCQIIDAGLTTSLTTVQRVRAGIFDGIGSVKDALLGCLISNNNLMATRYWTAWRQVHGASKLAVLFGFTNDYPPLANWTLPMLMYIYSQNDCEYSQQLTEKILKEVSWTQLKTRISVDVDRTLYGLERLSHESMRLWLRLLGPCSEELITYANYNGTPEQRMFYARAVQIGFIEFKHLRRYRTRKVQHYVWNKHLRASQFCCVPV
jgi:hypothetical protein